MNLLEKALDIQKQQKEIQDQLKSLLKEQENQSQQQQQSQQKDSGGEGQKPDQQGQGQGEGDGNNPSQGNQRQSGSGSNRRENLPHVIDNHEVWRSDGQTQEETKMAVQAALNEAMDEARRQYGEGSIPANIKNMLNEALKPAKVNWRKILSNYIGRKISFERSSTRKRPNRRLGLIAPGKTLKLGPKTLFAVDCSGSVNDHEYLEIMSEVDEALKCFPEKCEMMFFDWEVFKEKLKLNSLKKLPRRPLNGGTNFQPVINYAKEYKPDLLIILTDGEAPVPTKPPFPVLWVIIGAKDNPALFGKRIVIDPKDLKKVSKALGA